MDSCMCSAVVREGTEVSFRSVELSAELSVRSLVADDPAAADAESRSCWPALGKASPAGFFFRARGFRSSAAISTCG